MSTVRVIGVDPGLTGAAVETFHDDSGVVRIGSIWAWSQPVEIGKKGQPTKKAIPMMAGGLAGVMDVVQGCLFDLVNVYESTIVRIEETWNATKSMRTAASHGMTAGPWLIMASPLDNYEFMGPDEWRKHYGWSGSLRDRAKELAIAWFTAQLARQRIACEVTEHVAEAGAVAMMPIPDGE